MKISIIGATGYTGFELVKLLSRHNQFKLVSLTSESYTGMKMSDVYPQLAGVCDIVLSDNDIDSVSESADAFFLCLPHKTAMTVAGILHRKGKIVIDLSADFRMDDAALYERIYGTTHTEPELLAKAQYGLAELFTDKIKASGFISVPGCYPTSIILPLYPLLKEGLIDSADIIADSKSGVSGAGRKPTPTNSFCESNEDFKPYGIFTHRHNAEINHILSKAGKALDLLFTPHLLPVNRGILSTIYAKSTASADDIRDVWRKYYEGRRLIRVKDSGIIPAIKNVANTSFADIAVFKRDDRVIIVSAIDNLLKGASGQALQCLNIIAGADETEGLV